MGASQKSRPPPTSIEAQIKMRLMDVIDRDLRRRFRTLEQMADFARVDILRLSRLRARRHEYISIAWLLRLAESAHVKIRIDIY